MLFPLAAIYNAITRLRNRLYDLGLKPSTSFSIPVISIGNLTIGGTGKTPCAEYLIRLLFSQYKLAVLSRGYGRKTKGFRVAGVGDSPTSIGDEPYQIFNKYGDRTLVGVCEDRVLGVASLLQMHSEIHTVLLDDAFQHRRIRPSLSILLTDFNRPFYKDSLLPAGRLREAKSGAGRADVVVVTKCPDHLDEEQMIEIQSAISGYTDCPMFFTRIRYGVPVLFGNPEATLQSKVLLISGIANSTALRGYVEKSYQLVEHIEYPDHHTYSRANVRSWASRCPADAILLTTEKDMVKLIAPRFRNLIGSLPVFYLPMEMEFVKNGEEFDAIVVNHVEEYLSKSALHEE